MNTISSSGCDTSKRPPATPTESVHLAIATVPMQSWEQPYDPAAALKHGTIFPSLNLPFYVTGGDL